ncbi:CHAT domain-containing protein [Kibdelosporangium aridum]|uniref:CHAT domain-containing protein n=1 Tax=Kibdelosporangium aridum TaxID=2030 RepID=A0A428ZH65_KIBAR|nr:CHAT domain-containing protein [Kibdelosporangium aridum]RSM87446.1 CHAT domain-containing protein [Kibdelosporangium aridum]
MWRVTRRKALTKKLRSLTTRATELFGATLPSDASDDVGLAIALTRRAEMISKRLGDVDPDTRIELSTILLVAFDYTRDDDDLASAVAHARTALSAIPLEQDGRLVAVVALGRALVTVADVYYDDNTLDEALDLLRPAVASAAPDDPYRATVIIALLQALVTRRAHSNDDTVIVDTIMETKRLVELLPEDFSPRDMLALSALLGERAHFMNRGDLDGMRASQPAIEDQLDRLEPGAPYTDRYRLASMEQSLMLWLLRREPAPAEDIAEYVELFRHARLTSPERLSHLESLSTHVLAQVDLTNDIELLDHCIDLLTDGMRALPESTAEYRSLGGYLGNALAYRFDITGDAAVLERAITLQRQRMLVIRPGTTKDALARSDLGSALRRHYLLTGDERSYDEAMTLLRTALTDTRFVAGRLNDARKAGELAAAAGRWNDAADAFAEGVGLLPALAWLGLDRADQEQNLAPWSEFVNQAAAAHARAGKAARAVEILEHGRAVLTHHTLDIRSDTARLRAALPDLAARLDRIQLDLTQTSEHARRHALARDWDTLVADIRTRAGFTDFLRAPRQAALRPADGQTVVMINVAVLGCDAFVVTSAGVQLIPLPELTAQDVATRAAAFHYVVAKRDSIAETLDWMWRTITAPVLDALGHTGRPAEDAAWPRVHWCPTGMLGFLPLHAAAAQDPAAPGDAVLDRVVSSYAISLRTLGAATRHRDPPAELRSLLVVSMPHTPSLTPLPGATREKDKLAALVHTAVLDGDRAVHSEVSTALRKHAWAHFACHAEHHPRNPSRSTLFLHDHQTTPFTVLDISRLRLEHAQLAYLSACETARGSAHLPNEALHLGGALQLAGYQHVIATLWRIHDKLAATVAEQVYDHFHDGPTLEPTRAARAVHHAVLALRHRFPDDPALWASYVHFGP